MVRVKQLKLFMNVFLLTKGNPKKILALLTLTIKNIHIARHRIACTFENIFHN
jgi:hypothetical protein